MIDDIKFLFHIFPFWFFLLVILVLGLIVVLILTFCNPCIFGHLDAYAGQNYCDLCSEQLRPYCISCDDFVHPGATFCDECGSLLIWEE